jgi:TnpA family transposase
LDKKVRLALDALLENEGAFYKITLLRKDPKDFSTQEMRREVAKQQILLEIYEQTKGIIPKLDISSKNIEYYSDMAKYYPPFNLRRFKKNLARLYLLCYVHQRLLKVNDHLIAFFTYRTDKYYQDAEQDAKEKLSHDESRVEERLIKAGKLIKLYSDKRVDDNELRPAAFQIVPRENINQFAKELTAVEAKKNRFVWQFLEKQSRAIKINLRPVFQAIVFNCDENGPIKKAVDFLRNQMASNLCQKHYSVNNVPLDFLPKSQQIYVIEKCADPNDLRRKIQIVNANRYEYAVYMVLEKMLDSGQVYIPNTINYRRLEDDLIPLEYWLANRDKILSQLNLSILNQPIQTILENLNVALVERYHEVNRSIRKGNNRLINLNKNNKLTWRLPNKKQDDAVNNPFYESFPNINIGDVIRYVIESTQFSKKFNHIQPYYSKNSIEINNLIAVLIANGAGFGIRKMADISDMKLNELVSTNRNFFRLRTLREANDLVVNQIARLPIFKFYTLSEYGIHASIDGQKVETKNHTIKARYSKKYFGLGKGVVSIKLVANHVPINDKIIGANEYEGHYLFDLVYNNSSEIDVYAVSGDMHSINRVNFALMYLFGYRFMPRFTHLPEKAQENLVSFQNQSQWEKYIIKPKNKVDEALIVSQWDNILRILASLAMKETTQATVVRKLSSYKRTNPTLKALIEFDKIITSLYLLDYIDDPDMRSNVHRSLNRGEALHQLISAIRKVSDKKLPGKNEIEMEMYNECNRLIANCVIYYNATLLSKLYEASNNNELQAYCDMIKRLSPVAWQHINLVGKYEFLKNQETINIQELIETALLNSEINFGSQMHA